MKFKLLLPLTILLVTLKLNAADNSNAQALYIYNFIRYVKWPDNALTKDFVIAVYGESSIYNDLVALSKNRKVGTQNISIIKISKKEEISQCQLIYFPASKKQIAKEISAGIGNQPILLVSEASISSGCTIEFIFTEDKLQFKVNEEQAKQQNLYMSQVLLKLAYKI
jgi:hypothetical protein